MSNTPVSVTPRGSIARVSFVLLLIVLLPALFYSAYEINGLSGSEELIGQIYRQQLDVILYSVNLYAWDAVGSWASTITGFLNEAGEPALETSARSIAAFMEKNSPLRFVFIADTNLTAVHVTGSHQAGAVAGNEASFRRLLQTNSGKLERLKRFRELDYRKFEPLSLEGDSSLQHDIALVFIAPMRNGKNVLIGMVVEPLAFVNRVLSTKLQEAAGEEFVLAVLESGRPDPLFTTGDQSSGELKQKKTLWLFPDYQVGIRMKGAGVEEILKARFVKNILLILVLDLIIIAGAWVVYRGIRREMELVRLKSDFVSNVSHELRTPLSVIRMYTETLEMGRIRDEEKKTEYLTTILRESERLTRLVNNILSFSRMEAGKKEFHLRSTDLNALVTQVLETYGPHLANEGFSPAVDLNPTISPVRADGEAVAEAIINLLDNAVKYSDREKYIRISTGTQDGMVFVAVEDRGIGIAPEHQQKVFDSFYRVSTGLVHTSKGSGIGLAIVRQIMEAHHGKVGLVSEVGKGSTFRVLFPVDPASKAGAVQS